jgi:undecaprenyl-diphosphatase
MTLLQALLLGVVQGLTEFLPVSSTAHLYIAQAILRIRNDEIALAFDVVLHLGTALALLIVFRETIVSLIAELFRWATGRPAQDPASRNLLLPLLIGTIPGVLAGLFLLKRVESIRTLALIGASMLLACVYFLLAERAADRSRSVARTLAQVNGTDAIVIGLAQASAGLMAGFSRSGLTIATGLFRGLRRNDSARFSFLLALPLILGAGAKALLDLRHTAGPSISAAALATGFLSSAIVGIFAIRFLLSFFANHSLRPFAIYLGLLGTALLIASVYLGMPFLAGG